MSMFKGLFGNQVVRGAVVGGAATAAEREPLVQREAAPRDDRVTANQSRWGKINFRQFSVDSLVKTIRGVSGTAEPDVQQRLIQTPPFEDAAHVDEQSVSLLLAQQQAQPFGAEATIDRLVQDYEDDQARQRAEKAQAAANGILLGLGGEVPEAGATDSVIGASVKIGEDVIPKPKLDQVSRVQFEDRAANVHLDDIMPPAGHNGAAAGLQVARYQPSAKVPLDQLIALNQLLEEAFPAGRGPRPVGVPIPQNVSEGVYSQDTLDLFERLSQRNIMVNQAGVLGGAQTYDLGTHFEMDPVLRPGNATSYGPLPIMGHDPIVMMPAQEHAIRDVPMLLDAAQEQGKNPVAVEMKPAVVVEPMQPARVVEEVNEVLGGGVGAVGAYPRDIVAKENVHHKLAVAGLAENKFEAHPLALPEGMKRFKMALGEPLPDAFLHGQPGYLQEQVPGGLLEAIPEGAEVEPHNKWQMVPAEDAMRVAAKGPLLELPANVGKVANGGKVAKAGHLEIVARRAGEVVPVNSPMSSDSESDESDDDEEDLPKSPAKKDDLAKKGSPPKGEPLPGKDDKKGLSDPKDKDKKGSEPSKPLNKDDPSNKPKVQFDDEVYDNLGQLHRLKERDGPMNLERDQHPDVLVGHTGHHHQGTGFYCGIAALIFGLLFGLLMIPAFLLLKKRRANAIALRDTEIAVPEKESLVEEYDDNVNYYGTVEEGMVEEDGYP